MSDHPQHETAELQAIDDILARYPAAEPSLIQVLQDIQRHFNYLPGSALLRTSEVLGVPLARVMSVATFYKAFSLKPVGKVVIKVCMGTACHIRGADLLVQEVERQLGIKPGETTEDGMFTLTTVNCVGACAMAPVMIAGTKYHGTAKAADVPAALAAAREGRA
jgi:NADH-quinone oxidoreductase subunit E